MRNSSQCNMQYTCRWLSPINWMNQINRLIKECHNSRKVCFLWQDIANKLVYLFWHDPLSDVRHAAGKALGSTEHALVRRDCDFVVITDRVSSVSRSARQFLTEDQQVPCLDNAASEEERQWFSLTGDSARYMQFIRKVVPWPYASPI